MPTPKSVTLSDSVYDEADRFYQKNKYDLSMKGINSFAAYVTHLLDKFHSGDDYAWQYPQLVPKYSKKTSVGTSKLTKDQLIEKITNRIESLQDSNNKWEASYHATGAVLFNELDDNRGALKLIDAALKISPDEPDYYHIKGEILLDLERPKEAISYIDRCIMLEDELCDERDNPRHPSSFMIKGEAYHDLEKYEAAVDYYLEAVKIFNKQKISVDRWSRTLNEAFGEIGHAYLHIEKYRKCLEWLQKAEKQKPYDTTGQLDFDKAEVLVKMKKYKMAVKSARKAVKLDPGDGEYWLMLAYCLAMTDSRGVHKSTSLNVLRALSTAIFVMPDPETHKPMKSEVQTIGRYLKNIDDGRLVESVIGFKKALENIGLD